MKKETYQLNVEYTDTFGGEANYSWVERKTLDIPAVSSDKLVMRRIRKALGLEGVKGRWNNYGDHFEFRPYGMCQIVFADVAY